MTSAGLPDRIYLATCADLPDGDDEDGELLRSACRNAGLDASWQVWDDSAVDWSVAMTVVRATWDYTARPAEFLRWANEAPRLHNPSTVLRWNSDKSYLRALAGAGVSVVPTAWASRGEPVVWPQGVEFVVKPTVGAGSLGAGRFVADDITGAQRHLDSLHAAGRTAMIQPYVSRVDEAGETGLVFIDGNYTHAIRKASMLPPDTVYGIDRTGPLSMFRPERISLREPSEPELAVARSVLTTANTILGRSEPLLYARVDLLPGDDGPVVIELELAEPSLFLSYAPAAATRLAEAIAVRAGRG